MFRHIFIATFSVCLATRALAQYGGPGGTGGNASSRTEIINVPGGTIIVNPTANGGGGGTGGNAIGGNSRSAALSVEANPSWCPNARTRVEIVICQNPGLGQLDSELNGAFQNALGNLSQGERQSLRREQASWLRLRDACGTVGCVENAYRAWLSELQYEFGFFLQKYP